jgi:hypothetical protein
MNSNHRRRERIEREVGHLGHHTVAQTIQSDESKEGERNRKDAGWGEKND